MAPVQALAVVRPEAAAPALPAWATAGLTVHGSREEWLRARAEGIGGSESAIIMGASTWGSAYKLYLEKSGLVAPSNEDNEVLRFGRVVEPLIATEYEALTGRRLLHVGDWAIRRSAEHPFLFCTHDRLIEPVTDLSNPRYGMGPGVLSIKSANVWRGIEWIEGEEPPLSYQVQMQHELAVSGLRWGSFAVLIWGQGVRWLDVERNDEFIGELVAATGEFWERVMTRNPPPVDGSEHTRKALGRLHPQDCGAVVELPAEAAVWAERLDAIKAEQAALKEEDETIRNKLRERIGDASEGYVPGGPAWTYKTITRKECTQAASTYRELRRKGAPKKKKGK